MSEKEIVDLLDEIECDPMFQKREPPAKSDIQFNYLRKRVDELQLQSEAILLMIKACEIGSEALYQAALEHILKEAQIIAEGNIEMDEAFINKSTNDFIENSKHLGLLPLS
jgi:hypothetical protein